MMRAPTPAEAIAQAIAVAKATDVAADRVSILRTVIAAIDNPQNCRACSLGATGSPLGDPRPSTRSCASNRSYAELGAAMLKRASSAAGRADVRAVQGVLEAVVRKDAELGRKRPDEINALIEQVRAQLDAARRLRLARDQWAERAGGFRSYMKSWRRSSRRWGGRSGRSTISSTWPARMRRCW